jgi:anti-sigma factor RsiW
MEYVGNELEPDVHQHFEVHIAECDNCKTYLAQYQATIQAGQLACEDANVSNLPDDLVQAVLAAIAKEPR